MKSVYGVSSQVCSTYDLRKDVLTPQAVRTYVMGFFHRSEHVKEKGRGAGEREKRERERERAPSRNDVRKTAYHASKDRSNLGLTERTLPESDDVCARPCTAKLHDNPPDDKVQW